MALFSRRKKTDDAAPAETNAPAEGTQSPAADASTPAASTDAGAAAVAPEAAAAEAAPSIGISVQAFRGVGATAGPEVSLEPDAPKVSAQRPGGAAATAGTPSVTSPTAAPQAEPAPRTLPLAPALPPEQTETVKGMKDNVLLREALAQLEEGATNEQLIGVLRQALQGHLFLRVHGDARQQLSEGKPLSVGVVRDGERSFMLAFSSAGAVRDSVQRETEPTATSAIAQPVTAVLQQVVSSGFTGLIIDNASGVHRAVFPTEVLQKALEQADPDMTIKTLLAAPREADTAKRVGEALARTKAWVAVNDGSGSGQVGIAEARTTDGKRFLQLYSHPLEVVALGRGDRPMPFTPEQLAKVLSKHPEMAGVLVDSAGPSIIVERDDLAPVLVLAVDLGDE